METIIRPIKHEDFTAWRRLWNENNQGQKNEAVTTETWARLNNPNSPVHGLIAQGKTKNTEGQIIGLLHYITHPTTGALNDICYMQDVYVDPEFRGQGVAKKMIEYLVKESAQQNWARIYWLAEANNAAAQALYKNIGIKLDFTFYAILKGSSS